ncbi:MAG TPA: amino acid permease [Rhizomicrobium sp.]|jgi:arginine:agmatine antiporter|nr:amino acid permease [Rhizomicrobium sp.]
MQGEPKKIGPLLAIAVVASTMIGSGIFLLPASLGAVGSISILSWLAAIAGAMLIAGALCWLIITNPAAGGLFSYVRTAFGPTAGFAAGALYWASCLIADVAVALAVTGYLSVFIPLAAHPPGATAVTVIVVWLLVGANIVGPRFVAGLQGWALTLGLFPVFLAAIGGWFFFRPEIFLASWNVTGQSAITVIPAATVTVFWAFLGLETAIVLSTRVKNPARDVPIGTLGGVIIAALIYVAACAAIMGILPAAALAKSAAPFADAFAPVLGASIAAIVALCAVVKASGTLGSSLLLTVETAQCDAVMGQVLPASAARAAHKASMPNLIFTGVAASLIAIASESPTLVRQFTIVTNVAVILSVIIYGMAALALLRLSASLAPGRRWAARAVATGALLFCAALIASAEPTLLAWTAAAIAITLALYASMRVYRVRRAAAAPGL